MIKDVETPSNTHNNSPLTPFRLLFMHLPAVNGVSGQPRSCSRAPDRACTFALGFSTSSASGPMAVIVFPGKALYVERTPCRGFIDSMATSEGSALMLNTESNVPGQCLSATQ